MAKKKTKKEDTKKEDESSYNYLSDLIELEPKNYVRAGFVYYVMSKEIKIKSKSELKKVYDEFMKKD